MERQDLSQTPELAGGAEATVHQDINRLTGIQTQTAIGIIGARPEARNCEGDVCRWQATRIDLEIGRIPRLMRGAAPKQGKKCDERGKRSHDRP